jgi:hypothetical protein
LHSAEAWSRVAVRDRWPVGPGRWRGCLPVSSRPAVGVHGGEDLDGCGDSGSRSGASLAPVADSPAELVGRDSSCHLGRDLGTAAAGGFNASRWGNGCPRLASALLRGWMRSVVEARVRSSVPSALSNRTTRPAPGWAASWLDTVTGLIKVSSMETRNQGSVLGCR